MTTSNDPRGRLQQLFAAPQAALATAASTGFVRRHFYDWTPSPQEEPQDDDILGDGFQNSIDARPAAPDIHRASARVAWPLDLIQIGYALTDLLGAPAAPTGSGPYVHVWDSSTVQIPSRTIERKLAASGQFDGAIGAVCRSLRFPVGSDRGYARVDGEYFLRQDVDQYAVSIAGTPTLPTLSNRVPRAVGSITRGGSALGSIISGDITISNVLGEDNYDGSKFIDDVQLEGRTAALNLTGRFKGAALRDLGKVAVGAYLPESADIVREYQLSAAMKLTLTVRNVRLARVGIGASGPGRMDVPLRGRAEVGASSAMVSVSLTNSQSTTYA